MPFRPEAPQGDSSQKPDVGVQRELPPHLAFSRLPRWLSPLPPSPFPQPPSARRENHFPNRSSFFSAEPYTRLTYSPLRPTPPGGAHVHPKAPLRSQKSHNAPQKSILSIKTIKLSALFGAFWRFCFCQVHAITPRLRQTCLSMCINNVTYAEPTPPCSLS